MNPKLSLQNCAGENLKLRNLKPSKITHYLEGIFDGSTKINLNTQKS